MSRRMPDPGSGPLGEAAQQATQMYRRMLANWAFDTLANRPELRWPQPDAPGAGRDRDWSSLYAGSVLDD